MSRRVAEKVKFGMLKVGEKFISFPDKDGGGGEPNGFLVKHYIFMKIKVSLGNSPYPENAVKLCTGSLSYIPKDMDVIRVE